MFKKWTVFIVMLLALAMLFSAFTGCTKKEEPAATTKPEDTTTTQEQKEETATEEPAFDPMAKYDPEITVSVGWQENSFTTLGDGESYDNNAWTKLYKEELGIILESKWIVPSEQYEQKVSLDLAANDIPDMLVVRNAPNLFLRLQSSGMLADLTDVFDKYATDGLKSMFLPYEEAFNAAKIQGRLYSIPILQNPYDYCDILWLRSDWLDNLGLGVPTSMEELLDVARAFANDDPDMDGEDDTIGIALSKDLYGSAYGLNAFAAGFGAYPNAWILDDSGQPVYGSIQPEMREVLLALQGLFNDGAIDIEFGVKDAGKLLNDTAAGKIGLECGAWWNPDWPLADSKYNDENVEWMPLAPVKVGGGTAQPLGKKSTQGDVIVSADFDYPEALIKMENMYHYKRFNRTEEEKTTLFHNDADDYSRLAFAQFQDMFENFNAYLNVNAAVEANDATLLKNPAFETAIYEGILAYMDGDVGGWSFYTDYYKGGSLEVLYEMSQSTGLVYDELYISGTETMNTKWATMFDEELQVFTRIILGADISEFDQFVNTWYALGGEQITQEVQDWYANK